MSHGWRRRTLLAGVALIVLTNLAALAGVAWNRSATDSSLRLSQRELRLPWGWGMDAENSGLILQLSWRVVPNEAPSDFPDPMYRMVGGEAPWLDQAKLAELGFEVPQQNQGKDRARFERQLPREVLLVLELDGPAYRHSVERTRLHVAAEEALLQANQGKPEFVERAKRAREALEREEHTASRLFVVDAGLDAATLRASYADRSRYAMVRGEVRPQITEHLRRKPGEYRFGGYVTRLSIEGVNVPYALRALLEPLLSRAAAVRSEATRSSVRFEATVAFGKRFEPWLTAVTPGTPPQPSASVPRP